MQNLLQYRGGPFLGPCSQKWALPWACALLAVLGVAASTNRIEAQSTGDPSPNALDLGPRCPTCPIVIQSRALSMKDKEERTDRSIQKKNYAVANAARKKYIDDETNNMLILARDLKAKIDVLGSDRPTAVMQKEAAMIEFLAKDIKEKMKLTVNPD